MKEEKVKEQRLAHVHKLVVMIQVHHPSFEPPHGKTINLHKRKQRRRSASR